MSNDVIFNEIMNKVENKMDSVIPRNLGKIPYSSKKGVYDDKKEENISWWTNGFYAGELWQLFQFSHKVIYKENAEAIEVLLDQALIDFEGLHHDVGFMWMLTAVADYRLTGNKKSRKRGLHAASLLAGRFNLAGNFIRSWNGEHYGWVIIDSMMNLPLLFWASKETGDPRYQEIACAHASTVAKYLVRADGSVGHIACFDPNSGEFIGLRAGQGYAASSSWSRGQAWAIYGFIIAYQYTKNEIYLNVAKKVANYFITCIAQTDYLPLADFRAPLDPLKWDMSAGTCAACGILAISQNISGTETFIYKEAAEKILLKIADKHVDWNPETDGLVQYASHSYHKKEETHISLIYGDYFFIEGILRLMEKNFDIW